jgi:hypothetical protein
MVRTVTTTYESLLFPFIVNPSTYSWRAADCPLISGGERLLQLRAVALLPVRLQIHPTRVRGALPQGAPAQMVQRLLPLALVCMRSINQPTSLSATKRLHATLFFSSFFFLLLRRLRHGPEE